MITTEQKRLEQLLKNKYTRSQPCVAPGVIPAPRDPHIVWLRVNQQSFRLGDYSTKQEADYSRRMLAKALAVILSEMGSLENKPL